MAEGTKTERFWDPNSRTWSTRTVDTGGAASGTERAANDVAAQNKLNKLIAGQKSAAPTQKAEEPLGDYLKRVREWRAAQEATEEGQKVKAQREAVKKVQ